MKRKIQRQVTEYYTNGQVKMVLEYRGNWKSGDFTVGTTFSRSAADNLVINVDLGMFNLVAANDLFPFARTSALTASSSRSFILFSCF